MTCGLWSPCSILCSTNCRKDSSLLRGVVLTEWTERFISESNPWNAAEMRVLAYVVVGDEAKARAAARIAKDAQPNTTVGTQMKEYIDYLLSPLKSVK